MFGGYSTKHFFSILLRMAVRLWTVADPIEVEVF
jgi:hypothetical protein